MHTTSSRVTAFAIAAAVAVVVIAVASTVLWWPDSGDGTGEGSGDDSSDQSAPATVPSVTDAPTSSAPGTSAPVAGGIVDTPDGSFLIASLASDVDRFAEPDGEPAGIIAATWHDRPSHLPVIDQQAGWLQVRLPQRPNGSTAWVRRADVELTSTPYRVEIDVATMRLRLFDAGERVLDAPAGVGTDAAPTTVGNFFVTFLQEPPDTTSGWGPFVVVTSSHSETISDFESSGDAIAAIHGPLGAADRIGSTGARISHGCIRLHLDDLAVLRNVPAGSPVDVIDSSTGPRDDAGAG